ncbi:MAG TPA: flagellar basal body rod protein FlgB [Succinivibrionaceae bacterium]|nr:flagellar basal body rod protein FlgB [Succinivibrio sp.]HAR79914.1 flagellar basal body rod protein FlgB [Succinivibrionaceae bacterium]
MSAMSFDKIFGIHQHTMLIRTQRAEVLSGNLANADTPGYKARDLDFDVALKESAKLQEIKTGPELTKTSPRHMDIDGATDEPDQKLKYRLPYQADTGNGNTVEVDSERMKYMSNNIEYQATMQFLNGRISKLMKALRTTGQ